MNDDLLDAAMQDNTRDAQTALSGKADPNAPRDMYDLTPLHYAAHHGNAEIANMLLVGCDQPANVLAQDEDGKMPIHRAILLGHADVVEALLCAMEFSSTCKSRWPLNGDLAAAALEKPLRGKSLPKDLICRLVEFEALHISGKSLLHCRAITGRSDLRPQTPDLRFQTPGL